MFVLVVEKEGRDGGSLEFAAFSDDDVVETTE
jgi:hypothetical protein